MKCILELQKIAPTYIIPCGSRSKYQFHLHFQPLPIPILQISTIIIMQAIIATVALLFAVSSAGYVAPAGTFFTRAPAFDSAVIQSDRLGGNFAYSVSESHAYAAHTPLVQHVTRPVAVSYNAPYAAYPFAHPYAYGYAAAPLAYTPTLLK